MDLLKNMRRSFSKKSYASPNSSRGQTLYSDTVNSGDMGEEGIQNLRQSQQLSKRKYTGEENKDSIILGEITKRFLAGDKGIDDQRKATGISPSRNRSLWSSKSLGGRTLHYSRRSRNTQPTQQSQDKLGASKDLEDSQVLPMNTISINLTPMLSQRAKTMIGESLEDELCVVNQTESEDGAQRETAEEPDIEVYEEIDEIDARSATSLERNTVRQSFMKKNKGFEMTASYEIVSKYFSPLTKHPEQKQYIYQPPLLKQSKSKPVIKQRTRNNYHNLSFCDIDTDVRLFMMKESNEPDLQPWITHDDRFHRTSKDIETPQFMSNVSKHGKLQLSNDPKQNLFSTFTMGQDTEQLFKQGKFKSSERVQQPKMAPEESIESLISGSIKRKSVGKKSKKHMKPEKQTKWKRVTDRINGCGLTTSSPYLLLKSRHA